MNRDALHHKLAPPTVRAALLRAGMFLTGWELLKGEIQHGVRQFFVVGSDQSDPRIDPRYERDVLARHQHPFEASLLWLVDHGALSEAQAARVRELRTHRNEVAHELPSYWSIRTTR